MNDLELYFKLGFHHILSWSSVDHLLFLVALIIVFKLSDWKKLLYLTSLFTIAHTGSLLLSVYKLVSMNTSLIEHLILWSIVITAASNIFIKKHILQIHYYFSFIFGLIHGLGFASDFNMFIDTEEEKLLPLLEFALGIETAQVLIGLAILLSIRFCIKKCNISSRHFELVVSGAVIGYILSMF